MASICSHEHEGVFLASMGANIAETPDQTSTIGVEFMDPGQEAQMIAQIFG